MDRLDVVVVGGGAAGLSAALVLARARRRVLVVDAAQPRNRAASHMHGFLSRDGLPPGELLAAGRVEVAAYGGEIVEDEVTRVARAGASFELALRDGAPLTARRLVVATGLRDELPDVPGLWERWARDVLHCPYCHGYEVRDRRLGVLGGSPEAVRYAQIVRQWSEDVVYFAGTGSPSAAELEGLAARRMPVVEGAFRRVAVRDDRLVGLELADGRLVERDVLFVPPRFVPNAHLLAELGCGLADGGRPRADESGRTSVPGVWVAGNVVDPRAQVITAAGQGSAAAIAVNADLVDEDVRDATSAVAGT